MLFKNGEIREFTFNEDSNQLQMLDFFADKGEAQKAKNGLQNIVEILKAPPTRQGTPFFKILPKN